MGSYDSTGETLEHIRIVQSLMREAMLNLMMRSQQHDRSKLLSPEKAMFDEFTPKLRELTYGSPEYKATLDAMGPALAHHYAVNDHHPDHAAGGIGAMTLLSLIEMLCDWRAAGMRHADGDFGTSLRINRDRYGISDQLYGILLNTAHELGWI